MAKKSRDLSVNPCHMCMPMGGILAFKGIEGMMVMLHGSQGCSTYMRRHIAEHFDEPVDVGSSALNEKGTVYGGRDNLHQALDNIRKVYDPGIVGVLTTCLAETIGEDVRRICDEYLLENKLDSSRVVTASTPGYGGTHTEGYWTALYSLMEQQVSLVERHHGLNIIVPASLSPADLVDIKRWMQLFDVPFTLLPDFSETMDRPFLKAYQKIPDGGTPLVELRRMSGAAATLELGGPLDVKLSPGKLLEKRFGVPCISIPLPIGLAQTDAFFDVVTQATGKALPATLERERGLLMDAMIDGHKHAFSGRTALFGDPELVTALAGFCTENGMFPKVIVTGSNGAVWRDRDVDVVDEADLEIVCEKSRKHKVNLAFGPSNGKMIEEREGIPLLRIGFPVHDRLGPQRMLSIGYRGSALLLDRAVNTLLEQKYRTYRQDLYDKYYPAVGGGS